MNYLDLLLFIPIAFAGLNGYKRGFITELFSFLALIIALLVTMKLTNMIVLAVKPDMAESAKGIFFAYLIIFIGTYLLVTWFGKMVHGLLKIVQLGFMNKLAGLAFGILKTIYFLSMILLLVNKFGIIEQSTLNGSFVYEAIKEIAPWITEMVTYLLPFLKSTLVDLEGTVE